MRRLGARVVASLSHHYSSSHGQTLRLADRHRSCGALVASNHGMIHRDCGDVVFRALPSDGGEWQALAESVLVPVYAERFRISAHAQDNKATHYVRPHKHHRSVRPMAEMSGEQKTNSTYRYNAFEDTLALYRKCHQHMRALALHGDDDGRRASRLQAIAAEIAAVVAVAVQSWARVETQQPLAAHLLLDCIEIDQDHNDRACTLSATTFWALCRAGLLQRHLGPVCVDLCSRIDRSLVHLSEPLVEPLFALLFQGRCFGQIAAMARDLSPQTINGEIARFALCAIRNDQRQQFQQTSARTHKRLRNTQASGGWMQQEQSIHTQDAWHVLRQLERRSRQLVTAAHLAKLLDIDVAARAGLPRGIDVALREFARLGVGPDVHALTLLINMYVERGSHADACRIYEHMCAGTMVVAQETGDPAPRAIAVPQPNDVTRLTIAKMWCAEGAYDRVLGVVESMRQGLDPQRLVTRLVASMVDSGELDAAEAVWLKHGCDYAHGKSSLLRINRRALAKLIIGYSRAGNIDRAIVLLRVACSSESSTSAMAAETPHMTDLLNAVLRECLSQPLLRRDLDVVALGIRTGVRFNVATYNVLFASLSRAAHAQSYVAPSGSDTPAVTRDEIAGAMQRLYRRMLDEGLAPDDISFVHLLPMWMYVDDQQLVATHWRLLVQGKPPHKTARLREHVVHQARRWGISANVLANLLDASTE
ncbi:hypothetical protein EV175_000603 [Coemansia sp. RSA 1933]|nr:hypothetical protein EV175_000603 [Coemansia sp. RSA 1933]